MSMATMQFDGNFVVLLTKTNKHEMSLRMLHATRNKYLGEFHVTLINSRKAAH